MALTATASNQEGVLEEFVWNLQILGHEAELLWIRPGEGEILEAIKALPLVRIFEDGIGLVDGLHLGRRPCHGRRVSRGITIRMVLASPTLVGQIYFPEGCLGAYPEDFVVVFLAHPLPHVRRAPRH